MRFQLNKNANTNYRLDVLKISVLCLSLSISSSFAAQKDFLFEYDTNQKKTVFNPHPMKDDLVLPLPCGSEKYSIVFRKIYTNTGTDSDMTNGFTFYDGSDDPLNAAIQSKRKCKVRGNFSDSKGNFYYLAKYELTTGQYDAIVNGKCKNSPKSAIPPTWDISQRRRDQKTTNHYHCYNRKILRQSS